MDNPCANCKKDNCQCQGTGTGRTPSGRGMTSCQARIDYLEWLHRSSTINQIRDPLPEW